MLEINFRFHPRTLLVHIGALLTFSLIPIWYRLPVESVTFSSLYVVRFLIFWTALLTIVVWFIAGLPGLREFRWDLTRVWWGLLLLGLGLWMYASGAWAFYGLSDPSLAANATLQFGVVALFVLAVACAGPSPRAVVIALAVGLLWNIVIAGAQVAAQSSLDWSSVGEFSLNPMASGVSVIQAGSIRWLRPYGLLPHPNMLAGFFCVVLLALVYGITSRSTRTALVSAGLFVVGLWVFLLTFSRGAWLSFAVGSFVMLPLLWRIKRVNSGLALTVICAVMTAVVFFIAYRPLLLARTGMGQESTELFSVAERGYMTQAALASIRESPLLGTGAGNFPWRASYYFFENDINLRGQSVHHVLMGVWAELGLVGFVLFAGAMVSGVEAALRRIKSGEGDSAGRAVLLAGFAALTVIGLFDHYPGTILHFQIAWWGLLAVALQPSRMLESFS